MVFLSILVAMALGQMCSAFPPKVLVRAQAHAWADFVRENCDAGSFSHAVLSWMSMVVLPSVLTFVMHVALHGILAPLAFLWSVALLCLTVNLHGFAQHFLQIRRALEQGQADAARSVCERWLQVDVQDAQDGEVSKELFSWILWAVHREVFGVIFVYAVFMALGLGPSGAVFYALASLSDRVWGQGRGTARHEASSHLQRLTGKVWRWVDWLPVRAMALGFAIAGNFEDAFEKWREQTFQDPRDGDALLLAATMGAMGEAFVDSQGDAHLSSRIQPSDDADTVRDDMGLKYLQGLAALVRRSLALWMACMGMLALAHMLA